jgi:excisionase family DNA binding protein
MTINKSKIKEFHFMKEIWTASDLAKYLKLSAPTIYKLAKNGQIPGFRIGDSWRFEMDEIQRSIQCRKIFQKKITQ